MKTLSGIASVLVPILVGVTCGWVVSDVVIGHPSSTPGWYDVRFLDPFFGVLQNLLFATGFALLALAARLVLGLILQTRLEDSIARWVSAAGSACLMLGGSAFILISFYRERAIHIQEVEVQHRKEDAQDKVWRDLNREGFSKLGWVRYPNVRVNDKIIKGGFEIQGSSASFMPNDDAPIVANYYLSRCEAWKENEFSYDIIVKNEGVHFQVYVYKKGVQRGSIFLSDAAHLAGNLNKGPTSAPQKAESPVDLRYPGAQASQEGDSTRLWTTDDVPTVLQHYRNLGATQIDQEGDLAESHTLMIEQEATKVDISIKHVFQNDGTKGTLIVIKPK